MTAEDHAYIFIGFVLLNVVLVAVGTLSWACKRIIELRSEADESE